MAVLSKEQINALMHGDEAQEAAEVSHDVVNEEITALIEQEKEVVSTEKEVFQPKFIKKEIDEMSEEELASFAQKQGWNPQYKGKNALSAKEYLAKSETEVPVMRDTIRRMADQMEQMQKSFERQRELDNKKYKKELETRLQELSNEKQKLKENGLYEQADFEKFEKVNQAELELKKELQESEAPVKSQIPIEHQKALEVWVARNTWYNTDIELTYEAEQRIPIINKIYPNALPDEKLRILEEHIKNRFPDNFKSKKPTTTKVEAVERSSNSAVSMQKTAKFSYNDLTPEDKAHFQSFKRMSWGLKKPSNVSNADFEKQIQQAEQETLQDFYEDYKSRGLLK